MREGLSVDPFPQYSNQTPERLGSVAVDHRNTDDSSMSHNDEAARATRSVQLVGYPIKELRHF